MKCNTKKREYINLSLKYRKIKLMEGRNIKIGRATQETETIHTHLKYRFFRI